MKRIPEALVRDIVSRSDIVGVVKEYVRLEKRGARWLGLCPFHNEKTPSFNVNPERGFFYCFGCKKGGDVVTFVKEIEKCGYVEALERLADRAGIPLRYEGVDDAAADDEKKRRDAIYELYERLAGSFHHLLTEDARGKPALDYARARGLSDEVIASFRLGYAPGDRTWLRRFLLGKSYSPEFLASSGLFSAKYPEVCIFSDRLMFPIHDARGRCVAFGGRLLAGDGPKYINSPETSVFRKHENLFGLSKAAKSIRDHGRAVLCEGYMDAIAFHAAGVDYAVAPLGTSFTETQAAVVKRYADTVVLSFDTDQAGVKAAERAIGLAEKAGLTALVLKIPDGKDPAEFAQKYGHERLKKEAESTITAEEFLLGNAAVAFSRGGTEGVAAAFSYLFPFIAEYTSELRRDAFLETAASRFSVDPASVRADFVRFLDRGRPRPPTRTDTTEKAFTPGPDAELLAALACHPALYAQFRAVLDPSFFEDEALRSGYIALEECFRRDDPGPAAAAAAIQDGSLSAFVLDRAATGAYDADPQRFVADGVLRLKEQAIKKRVQKLVARIRDYDEGRDGDEVSLNELLYEKMHLDGELTAIKDERNGR
ncbi:MAG: DNA primase [Spirochaetia bacterium]|nr:DNA primase [Spirochaetia bacterium]